LSRHSLELFEAEVQAFYKGFQHALMSGDTSLLEPIYADDCVLVRPNGDTLEKREILDDLRRHSMRFTSFEVNDVLIRIRGMVGILTADVRSTAMRVGVEVKTHARQLSIVSKEKSKITLFHFQSTSVADPK
jgi:ketosteroid isomerase-like protein